MKFFQACCLLLLASMAGAQQFPPASPGGGNPGGGLVEPVTFQQQWCMEGATADDFEVCLAATDPTADRNITLPDLDGTLMVAPSVAGMLFGTTAGGTTGRTLVAGDGLDGSDLSGENGAPTFNVDATVNRQGADAGAPPNCGDSGDAYQLGHKYYDSTTSTWYVCEKIDRWVPLGSGRGALILVEDFCGGSTSSNTIGSTGLAVTNINGGSTITSGTGDVGDHPCYLNIQESTDNDGQMFHWTRSWGTSIVSDKDWSLEFIFREPSTATGWAHWAGLINSSASTPLTMSAFIGVVFNSDLSHATYQCAMCDSATNGCQSAGDDTNQDVTASTVAPSASQWVYVQLWHQNVGIGGNPTFYCSVNGEAARTFAASGADADLDNFPAVTLYPFMAQQNQVGAVRNWDWDWARHIITGLSR